MIMTERNELRRLDLRRLKTAVRQPVVIDIRSVLDMAQARALGLLCEGTGLQLARTVGVPA